MIDLVVEQRLAGLVRGLEGLGVCCEDKLILEDEERVTVILTTSIDLQNLGQLLNVASR